MLSGFRHGLRLARAGLVLARYDVVLPDGVARAVPAPLRLLGRIARLMLGPVKTKADGRGGRLSAALAKLGPAYIKLGQFLATRPDILGTDLSKDLATLQDKLPPFAEAEARATLERELGRSLTEIFEDFGPAIAAASIAEVHKARLRGDEDQEPRDVAVKILRPGINETFKRDIAAFDFAAALIEKWRPDLKRLEPKKLVETLRRSVDLELDLRFEAAAASEMAEAAAGDPDYRVPEIIWGLTTSQVLTTEWIEATPIADREALARAGYDFGLLANQVIRVFLKQALRDGLFHADMHPGNLFVERRGADDPLSRLVAVDYGIIGRLDRPMRRFMAETLFGFLTRDYRRIAQIHFDVGFVGGDHRIDDFAQALRSIGEPVFGRAAGEISMARLLAQLLEVTRLFDMHLQPQLVLLQKTMVVVEGVARELDERLDIWEAARPVVESFMARELGPEARLLEVAEAAMTLSRAARRAPELIERMEAAANRLAGEAGEGLKLHPETASRIAAEEAHAGRNGRLALWIGAASLAAIALRFLAR